MVDFSPIHKVRDLPPDSRRAIEALLGRPLEDEENVEIQVFKPGAIIKPAPTGEEREEAFRLYRQSCEEIAKAFEGVPQDELEAIIDEACDYVRHHPE